ncbi:hypothetical protein ABXN37_07640 [Piscinibacter sakaiensis]|uniref:hypothetical protein n=1 Tax=Piscinibacter sakaiensis TaxID=1547922 RepID=UPI00372CDE3B
MREKNSPPRRLRGLPTALPRRAAQLGPAGQQVGARLAAATLADEARLDQHAGLRPQVERGAVGELQPHEARLRPGLDDVQRLQAHALGQIEAPGTAQQAGRAVEDGDGGTRPSAGAAQRPGAAQRRRMLTCP